MPKNYKSKNQELDIIILFNLKNKLISKGKKGNWQRKNKTK